MPKTKIDTVPGKEIKVTIYRGASSKGSIDFTDVNGDPVDLTGATVSWAFYKRGETIPEMTWTDGSEITLLANNLSWLTLVEPEVNYYQHEQTITLSDGFVIVNYGDAIIKDKVNV